MVARLAYDFQPDDADATAGPDAFVGEDRASGRERSRGWLGRLRSWSSAAAHRQRRRAGHAPALVADEDGRARRPARRRGWPPRNGDRSPSGSSCWRCARDRRRRRRARSRVAPLAPAGFEARGVGRGRERRHRLGVAEVGQRRRSPAVRRSLAALPAAGPVTRRSASGVARHRRRSAPRSTTAKPSTGSGSHGPTSPSGHWTRTSAVCAGPSPKCVQPSWPPWWPPPTVSSRSMTRSPILTLIQAPMASRFGAWLLEPDGRPVTHRRRRIGRPRSDARQRRTFSRRSTSTMSSRPSRLRSTTAAPRPRAKSTMPASSAPSTKVSIGLADEQVGWGPRPRTPPSPRRCPWSRRGP